MEVNLVSGTVSRIESRINTIINRFDSLLSTGDQESFKAEFEKILAEDINEISNVITENTVENHIDEKINTGCTSVVETAVPFTETGNVLPEEKESPVKEKILQLVNMFCDEIGVDPDLVKSMISIESNFDPRATSKCGAMGLMQLMPDTARSLGVEDAYDIYQNLNGGITMIRKLLESFNGDVKLALAAYNAGSGRVREYGGVPPIPETENYVNSVLSSYNPALL